jgi:hypothetical protein
MEFAIQIAQYGKIVDLYVGKKYHEDVFVSVDDKADWQFVQNWYRIFVTQNNMKV